MGAIEATRLYAPLELPRKLDTYREHVLRKLSTAMDNPWNTLPIRSTTGTKKDHESHWKLGADHTADPH